jgi:hypothetical protein
MGYCRQHFVTVTFLIERLGSISYRVKTVTSAQDRTGCLRFTAVLSSTYHFQTHNRLYCTQSFCRFRRETLKLGLLHHHYQRQDLSYSRFDLFCMGVAFSIFSLVDLRFFCHLERVYTLMWESVYRSFVVNVALYLCSTVISFTFYPTV